MRRVTSILIWAGIILLIIFWYPLLLIIRIFDRDPVRYRTGRMFRRLGFAISRINPNWMISLEGYEHLNDREPYVMVSNHLSNADIPVISNLPWEMKWIAKKELFDLPLLGWMLKLSGDISVDRKSSNKRSAVFKQCSYYLEKGVSVIFFPEGTRSRSGKLNKFAVGAFDLAIRENIPVLPIAVDGTQKCLPKKSWLFEPEVYVKLKVLDPVDVSGYSREDSFKLMDKVRNDIARQLSEWRGIPVREVDSLYNHS
ncbi:MAG: lysophospholipid acyltransferase family protein, partial [Balneolaceae bacterium]